MPVSATRVTVGTSAVPLASAADDDQMVGMEAVIVNRGPDAIFVGGSGVTTATGLEVKLNETLGLSISGRDVIYGVAATANNRADVLRTGTNA